MRNKIFRNVRHCMLFSMLFVFCVSYSSIAQDKKSVDDKDKYAPIKVNLNESGSKYMRFLFWNQLQGGTGSSKVGNNDAVKSTIINMRRLRMLAFGQFSPKFMLLLHIGTHSANAQNVAAAGKNGGSSIFVNDALGEYMIVPKKLYIGGGIHYWGGISRLQRGSTFKTLAMDNANSRSWLNFGRTGQFVREIGFYAKGTLGKKEKFQYAISVNDGYANYAVNDNSVVTNQNSVYAGARVLQAHNSQKARLNYTMRLEYQLLGKEGDKLPFKTGSSFGNKAKIFNIGGGIWYHPSAAILRHDSLLPNLTITELEQSGSLAAVKFEDAIHYALDAYLDYNGITAYALYLNTNYGTFTSQIPSRFSGTNLTFLAGYFIKGKGKTNFQPYVGYNSLTPDLGATNVTVGSDFRVGLNVLSVSNFLKLTMEYTTSVAPIVQGSDKRTSNSFIFQMQFVL